jgi:DNA-directed RNA polymerase subunit H (RpoH/RPB5)
MKLILPFSVVLPRKTKDDKVFYLNMNVFRTAHHMIMNQAKIAWKAEVLEALEHWYNVKGGQLPLIKNSGPFIFHYTAFPGNLRRFDIGNVLPAVQKFTDDALIELGIIEDDNYKVIVENRHRFGGVDKENPRIELLIESADSC